jgi:predicted RNase H-like HicB family nuclease
MTAEELSLNPTPINSLTYQILLEKHNNNLYSATIWGWPECKATGKTKEDALKILHQLLIKRLEKVEIVFLAIEIPKPEHPWKKFEGKYKDDPDFEEMRAAIEEYRRELDRERDEFYDRLDEEETKVNVEEPTK